MYICPDCGKLFDEEPTAQESRDYGEGKCFETVSIPCACGTYPEEAKECAICGEWEVADELIEGVCEYCLHHELTATNVENFINTFEIDKCTFEVNAALEYVFTSDEVNAILMRELRECLHKRKMMPRRLEDAMKTYLQDTWAQFLKE